jgi:hypothetical protein
MNTKKELRKKIANLEDRIKLSHNMIVYRSMNKLILTFHSCISPPSNFRITTIRFSYCHKTYDTICVHNLFHRA